MRTSLLLGTTFGGVATVLGIVSTALPYWVSFSDAVVHVSVHAGLWQRCTSGTIYPVAGCFELENAPDWFRVVQAFTIIGIVCLALGTIFAGYYMKNESMTSRLTISAIAFVTGGVSYLLAVIIYGAKMKEDFSTGFYLAIGTVLFAIIASCGIIISKRATGSYSTI